ncbi:anillin-like [Diachasmimorpha longicaudata]|uniref:anillin-like n=1 Tax=Diachasmimorpha longicaudata TaxID=58733 RepID=UPI0030B90900
MFTFSRNTSPKPSSVSSNFTTKISKMAMRKPPTFTERMLRRASSRTLPRQQKVIEAIQDEVPVPEAVVVTETKDNSLISALSTEIKNLERQIQTLEMERAELSLDPSTSIQSPSSRVEDVQELPPEAEATGDETKGIIETPKLPRKALRPNMESTRTSLLIDDPGPTSAETQNPMQESTISSIRDGEGGDKGVPDEVKNFLDVALGDELNNTTVTYGEQSGGKDRTNSHFNASELISEERSPLDRRTTSLRKDEKKPEVVGEEGVAKETKDTGTINRSLRFYRSLSQRIKKKIRSTLKRRSPEVTTPPTPPQRLILEDKGRENVPDVILRRITMQQSVIEQAGKALAVCRANKEFAGSSEEAESERLLLIGEIRKCLLQDEFYRLSRRSGETSRLEEALEIAECAQVTVQHVNLSLRECLMREPSPGDISEWFVVVVIEGTNVWGSSPVPRPLESLVLEVKDFICRIENLKPNFKIILKIYALKLKSGEVFNHEEKYHIVPSRLGNTFACPSPTKFLKKMEKHASPRGGQQTQSISSSFVNCGQVNFGLNDLGLSSPWPLTGVPNESVLLGTIDVNLSCRLRLSVSHQGFVNYGGEAGGSVVWNRRWCVLKDSMMMFWNYPREQESKAPVTSIDLSHCTDAVVSEVDRELCAKPRTIVMETVRMREVGDVDSMLISCRQRYAVQRHLLSYDTRTDLDEWKTMINQVITALRQWNVTVMKDPPTSPMISEI